MKFIKENITHFIVTNTHNTITRSFYIRKAASKVRKAFAIYVVSSS
ncbi:hypothetical protein PMEGAPR54_60280 [Priestia megaterium]